MTGVQTCALPIYALPTGLSLTGSNISGTPTVGGNSSTLLTATAAVTNKSSTDTINWVISAGDTYFDYVTMLLSANTPSSTFVADASTNSFNITVNGDTRPNNLNPYTPGYYSNYFDGTGDYLTMPNNAAFQFGTGDFTIEFWFFALGTGSYQLYDGRGAGTGTTANYVALTYLSGGYLNYYTADLNPAISGGAVSSNAWHHVALTRSGTSTRLFVDGSQVGSTYTDSQNYTNGTARPIIGGDGNVPSASSYYGYISNLRVLKDTAVYTATFTPPTAPLSAITNTQLLTCQSYTFLDNSTNNFTITKNGDTKVSGFMPFTPNTSYSTYGSGYFDGSTMSLTVASNSAFSLTGDFTIEAWVYLTSASGTKTIFTNRTSYANSTGLAWVTQSGSQALSIYTASAFSVVSSLSMTLNAWTHVALTRSGSTITQWVNGTSGGTGTNSSSFTDAQCFIAVNNSSGEYFPGYISNFRVVKIGRAHV